MLASLVSKDAEVRSTLLTETMQAIRNCTAATSFRVRARYPRYFAHVHRRWRTHACAGRRACCSSGRRGPRCGRGRELEGIGVDVAEIRAREEDAFLGRLHHGGVAAQKYPPAPQPRVAGKCEFVGAAGGEAITAIGTRHTGRVVEVGRDGGRHPADLYLRDELCALAAVKQVDGSVV